MFPGPWPQSVGTPGLEPPAPHVRLFFTAPAQVDGRQGARAVFFRQCSPCPSGTSLRAEGGVGLVHVHVLTLRPLPGFDCASALHALSRTRAHTRTLRHTHTLTHTLIHTHTHTLSHTLSLVHPFLEGSSHQGSVAGFSDALILPHKSLFLPRPSVTLALLEASLSLSLIRCPQERPVPRAHCELLEAGTHLASVRRCRPSADHPTCVQRPLPKVSQVPGHGAHSRGRSPPLTRRRLGLPSWSGPCQEQQIPNHFFYFLRKKVVGRTRQTPV